MYHDFRTVSEMETILSSEVQCLCTVPSAFCLKDATHFQSYLGQHIFPHKQLFT